MDDEWKKPIKKPIGVYVWLALILIYFGILRFISYLVTFRNANGEVALPIILVSLALSLSIVGAVVWAFIGENSGRVALLILVPLNILWIVLFAVQALIDDVKENDELAVITIIQQVFISLIVICFEWYFMTEKVVEYYKQDG